MKKWITALSSAGLLLSSNMAFAHTGHGENLLASFMHFLSAEHLPGILLLVTVLVAARFIFRARN